MRNVVPIVPALLSICQNRFWWTAPTTAQHGHEVIEPVIAMCLNPRSEPYPSLPLCGEEHGIFKLRARNDRVTYCLRQF